jgi:hypothetical protein
VGDEPSRVAANRRSLIGSLGCETWCEVKQVHGTTMVFEPEPLPLDQPGAVEADGLATARVDHALVIKTADCQPILLAHSSGRYIGALHVGWRGNVQDFPGKGVAGFCAEYEIAPQDVLAVRGPSLGPARAVFENFETEFGPEFVDWFDPQTRTVDLWRLTRDQLVAAGLKPGNIFSLDLCTRSLPDMFFSYRRSQTTGRQAGLIWIRR